MHLPDNESFLIMGCIKGDRVSQSKLYNLYASKMMGVCMRYAKSREEAEEILQEGFMRVFTYMKTFKGYGSLEGWIRSIMVNCALQRYKNKIHLKPLVELNTTRYNPAVDGNIIGDLGVKELINIIQVLTPAYRLVFNLYVFEGMKHSEIAKTLGISEGTSKSNLSDARAALKKVLYADNKMAGFKIKGL